MKESFGLVKHVRIETSGIYVQVILQQQVVEVDDAINHDAALGAVFDRTIEESVSAVQGLGEGGELRNDSGI